MSDIAERAISTAKYKLMRMPNSTFISTVLFSLKLQIDDSLPTAATDGTSLLINPDFFMSLSEKQRITLLAHEAWHVAFDHMSRRYNRDPKKWNVAGDYVINDTLLNAGFEPIDGWLYDPDYHGMSTEQVYNALPDGIEPDFDDLREPEGGEEESKEVSEQIKETILRGKLQAQAAGDDPGTMPGEIQRTIEEWLNPKLPWYTILFNLLNTMAKDDFSNRRPNRRFLPDFYLPSLYSEGGLEHIAIAFDTSGSVSDAEIAEGMAEIQAIRDVLTPEQMTVFGWDTQLNTIHTLDESQHLSEVEIKGGGGTNISPVLQWADTNKPNAIVIFTDGRFYTDSLDPKIPVFWIINGNPRWEYPFGTIIHY